MDVPTLKKNAFPTIFNFTEGTLSDMHMDEELMDCSDIEEISESEDEDFGKNEAFLIEHGVKQICRVCGSPTEEVLYPIFGQQGEVWNIAEKISRCLPIKVMPSDKISLLICAECINLLNTSYELIATSLRAEAEFLKEYPEDWGAHDSLNDPSEKGETKGSSEAANMGKSLHINGPVTCDLCGSTFTDMELFEFHIMADHRLEYPWPCRLCHEGYQDPSDLLAHKLAVHADDLSTCDQCCPSDGLEFHCDICGSVYPTEQEAQDHCLTHSVLACKCDSLEELTTHSKNHLKERFLCGLCGKAFSNRAALTNHQRYHCCKTKKPYLCSACDRGFWRLENLQEHVKIHDPGFWDKFRCNICNRPFRSSMALKNHSLLHTGNKPYQCEICGRTYNRQANMVKHRKLHKPPAQWDHECGQCGEKFERLRDLMVHLENIHEVINATTDPAVKRKLNPVKWICRFCGKCISTKLSLQDHERIHTGTKPYVCEWCGREFRSRPNLLQHHLTHTGDRKHACGVCGKRFSRKSFITQHMRVHTGEKPFECDVCGHRFTQAGDMRRHRKRHSDGTRKERVALIFQLK
uniref:Uncharacterized protein n=1 Tax=Timema shepardi TaxID=629360 RepID=A0A7R9AL34_TIMSH|nr:unnamed protein product [Timema shepardi]